MLSPANIGELDTPPPPPPRTQDMLLECMTVVACLKLSHKYNDHCSEYSNVCCLIHQPYFEDIEKVKCWFHKKTCYGQEDRWLPGCLSLIFCGYTA